MTTGSWVRERVLNSAVHGAGDGRALCCVCSKVMILLQNAIPAAAVVVLLVAW